jgi:hypothetical protein
MVVLLKLITGLLQLITGLLYSKGGFYVRLEVLMGLGRVMPKLN